MVAVILVHAFYDVAEFKMIRVRSNYAGNFEKIKKSGLPSILINIEESCMDLLPIMFEVQIYISTASYL